MSAPILRTIRTSVGRVVTAGPSRLPVPITAHLPRAAAINTAAPLRTRIKPRPSSPASRLSVYLRYHSTTSADEPAAKPSATQNESGAAETGQGQEDVDALRIDAPAPGSKSQPIGKLEPRLSLTFTCTADSCGHRSTHEFTKRSYTRGIVLVQCPSCKNRHLIADHLGWFKESTEDGKLRTVEDLLRAKGEKVRTGKVNFDGDIEYDPEAE